MKQGEIVEQGSHAELIQIPDGAYATLVRLQASAQHPALQHKRQPITEQLQHSADPQVLKKLISSQVGHWCQDLNPGKQAIQEWVQAQAVLAWSYRLPAVTTLQCWRTTGQLGHTSSPDRQFPVVCFSAFRLGSIRFCIGSTSLSKTLVLAHMHACFIHRNVSLQKQLEVESVAFAGDADKAELGLAGKAGKEGKGKKVKEPKVCTR